MPQETQEELIQFIFENKHRLREISLRMVLKIADLWKMAPDRYQALGHIHLHEAGGMMNDNKFQDFLQWAGYVLAGVVITSLLMIVLL